MRLYIFWLVLHLMLSTPVCKAQNVYTEVERYPEVGRAKRATIHFARLEIYSTQDVKKALQTKAPGEATYLSIREGFSLKAAAQAFSADTIGVAGAGFALRDPSQPYGLVVSNGKLLSPLEEPSPSEATIPNPTGILCVSATNYGQQILTVEEYKSKGASCKFAVQSGPLFIRDSSPTRFDDGRREARLLACQGQAMINHLFWIESTDLKSIPKDFGTLCARALVISTGRRAGLVLLRERSLPASEPAFPADAESAGSLEAPVVIFIMRK